MYMAPEFFAEENPKYSKSVDIFAMGMLFLTMLQAEPGQPLLSPRTGCHANFYSLPQGELFYLKEPCLSLSLFLSFERKTLLRDSPISENLFFENMCIFMEMHAFSSKLHKMCAFS